MIAINEIERQISETLASMEAMNEAVVQFSMIVALAIMAIVAMVVGGEIGNIIAVAIAAAIGIIVMSLFKGKGDEDEEENSKEG